MEPTDSSLIDKLWVAHGIVRQMVADRQYTAPEPKFKSREELEKAYQEHDISVLDFEAVTRLNRKVLIKWVDDKLRPASLAPIHQQISPTESKEPPYHRLILIYTGDKITPSGNTIISSWKSALETHIEIPFHLDRLQFNPSRHELVPQHIICSKATKEQVLARYSVTADQLDKIKHTDIQIRYIGAKRGQMIKIVDRGTDPATTSVSYSIVC